jgi:hypothetical protein
MVVKLLDRPMTKPRKKRPSDELFDYACSLFAADKKHAAVAEFESLHESYPDEMRVLLMLGGSYYEVERFTDAAACLEAVVQHRPTYELASSLLFHSLWHLGREREAKTVLHRYLTIAESSDFKGILDELEYIDAA